MRTAIRFVVAAVAVLFAANASFALSPSDLEYLNFSGWNHAQIAASGQTFQNVYGDIDATVTVIGTHPYSSTSSNAGILTGRNVVGSHSFRFVFSEPLQLITELKTVDAQEKVSIFTTGAESYVHNFGGAPVVAFPAGGISVSGVGFGVNPTGASHGYVTSFTDRMTLTYQSLVASPIKWETFRLASVPEPSSFGMIIVAGLGLVLRSRKRNS